MSNYGSLDTKNSEICVLYVPFPQLPVNILHIFKKYYAYIRRHRAILQYPSILSMIFAHLEIYLICTFIIVYYTKIKIQI